MSTYQVRVNKRVSGFVAVEADSSEEAWALALDSLNDGSYSQEKEERQIGDITLMPDSFEIPKDATPELVEELTALSEASDTLQAVKLGTPVDIIKP